MPAVLALGDIVLALAAVLLLWAAYELLRPPLVSLAARVPLIGGQLSGVIDAVITDSYFWAVANLKATCHFLVGLIMTPVHWVANLIDGFLQLIQDLQAAVSYLRYVVIPHTVASLWASVQSLGGQIQHYAYSLYQSAISYTQFAVGALQQYVVAGLQQVDQYAYALYQDSVTFTSTEVGVAEHYAADLAAAGQAYTTAAVGTAEQYAGALFGQAISYVGVQVTDLEQWTTATLAQDMAWVDGRITALDQYIAANLTQVYAYIGTAVGVVEADLGNLKTGCTDNLCGGLGDLATLANLLDSGGILAAILALATAAATDAKGTGDALADVAVPVATGFKDAIDALLSL